MKKLGYHWYIVVYRVDEEKRLSFYCNRRETILKSWGNAIFFNEYATFAEGRRWCQEVLEPTWHG
jgi:hypothetical protein